MTITLEILDRDVPAIEQYLKTQCTASFDPVLHQPKLTMHYTGVENFIESKVAEMVTALNQQ